MFVTDTPTEPDPDAPDPDTPEGEPEPVVDDDSTNEGG